MRMAVNNTRGQFRRMSMEELIKYAAHPIWKRVETTKFFYSIPLPLRDPSILSAGQILSRGIPDGQLRKIGPFLAATSPQSHIGPFLHAIDFLVPDGTEVLAGKDGKIIEIVEGSDEWGDGPQYRDKLNYATIMHDSPDGSAPEFSQYCHLAKGSVGNCGLQVGSVVKAGQTIAKVGKSGWTDRDHLHFIVFRNDLDCTENPFKFRSLEIKFDNL